MVNPGRFAVDPPGAAVRGYKGVFGYSSDKGPENMPDELFGPFAIVEFLGSRIHSVNAWVWPVHRRQIEAQFRGRARDLSSV